MKLSAVIGIITVLREASMNILRVVYSIWIGAIVIIAAAILPDAHAEQRWEDCVPVMVGVDINGSRIHIKCSTPVPNGIWWFAVAQSNSEIANRFMSLATTALVSGRKLSILYDTSDTSGASYGCGASDCRKPYFINIY